MKFMGSLCKKDGRFHPGQGLGDCEKFIALIFPALDDQLVWRAAYAAYAGQVVRAIICIIHIIPSLQSTLAT